MTTLAIDIGGTKLAAALIGADGQIRDRRELPTPASQTPEALRDALSALVSPLQAHAQRVAIASTGIIRDGSLLALNPHKSRWITTLSVSQNAGATYRFADHCH